MRVYVVWSHNVALIVLNCAAINLCWEIGLMGVLLCTIEMALIFYSGYKIQQEFKFFNKKDETAKVFVLLILKKNY